MYSVKVGYSLSMFSTEKTLTRFFDSKQSLVSSFLVIFNFLPEVDVENLIQKENTLTCVINNAFENNTLKIYKKTYYRPEDLYDVRYQPSFSPIVYPNETISFELNPYENLELRIYAKGRYNTYLGEWTKDTNISFKIPSI